MAKATVTPHTFKDELLNLNITAKVLNGFHEYHLTYEQLKTVLLKRQIIDEEDIQYKEYKKKQSDDIPDGRDETIKLLQGRERETKKAISRTNKDRIRRA